MQDFDCHLTAIVAGDTDAFGRWVAGAEIPLRLQLRRFAALVDIEAVLQEALLRTWQIAPRFKPDGQPNGLLRLSQRIARNLAVDFVRRHRNAGDLEALLETPYELVMPTPPDPFLRTTLLECQEKLPPKLGRALSARIENAGNEPDVALARRLKMRLNTFLQNITRARKLLAECLKRSGIDLQKEYT